MPLPAENVAGPMWSKNTNGPTWRACSTGSMRRTMKPSPRSCTRASLISAGVMSISCSFVLPGPLILHGWADLRTQDLRRPARKIGIAQAFAGHQHHVGLAVGDDGCGLFGGGDQAHRAGGDAGLAADA